MSDTVELLGERFEVAESVGAFPLMRFAKAATARGGTMARFAALYDLLEQCIAPTDWDRFQKHGAAVRADEDQLLGVVRSVFEVIGGRPTGRSTDSSDGPQIIEPSSTPGSSSAERVIARHNEAGRPDLALFVRKRQESLTA